MNSPKKAPFLRTENNYDTNEVSDATGLKCEDPSLAQQSARDETDINVIVRKFGLTGVMPQGLRVPRYGDFSSELEFRDMVHVVKDANDTFNKLPAGIRARFNNDPVEFVEFCEDPNNLDELRTMGLAEKPAPKPTVESPEIEAPRKEPTASKDTKA